MRFDKFLPKILLVVGFLALFLIIKYQSPIKEKLAFHLERISIYFDNFFYHASSKPERHRPVSLLERETELKLYIGQPFRDFTRKDWARFWNLIYGAFPKEAPEKQGLPRKARQLTQGEIASELILRYPNPFSYFQKNHWEMLFSIVLKK